MNDCLQRILKGGCFLDSDGRLRGDTTNRRMLKSLHESEERYSLLFTESRSVKLIIDPHSGTILDANNAAASFYGYCLDELRGMPLDRLCALPRGEVLARLEEQSSRKRNHFEIRHRLASGSFRDMEVHSSTLVHDGREVVYSILQDITDRKLLEAEYRQFACHRQPGLDASSLMQAKARAEKNAAAQERLARAARELACAHSLEHVTAVTLAAARGLTGAPGASFMLGDQAVCHYALEEAAPPLWKGGRFPMDACVGGWAMRNRRPAVIEDTQADERVPREAYGNTLVKSLVVVPVRRQDPLAAIGAYWPEKKAADPQDVRLLESLADMACVAMENVRLYDELTLRARELKAQKERAEEASKAKSLSLASMSHEIRTPMNGVLGLMDLILMEEGLSRRARDFLLLAKQSGQNLLAIIGDILDLSKVEAGMIELENRPFSLKALLGCVLPPLEMAARQKGLAFTLIADPRLPGRLHGDKGRLGQVITNIVGNAVKFTSRGRVEVCVTLDPDESAGDASKVALLFRVEDTGMGIPQAKQDAIFENFSQVHASGKNGGTGLGLAISRTWVEMMGGRLRVESLPGKGSVFTFGAVFGKTAPEPIGPGVASEDASPCGQDSLKNAPRCGQDSLRILLVEDNRINKLFVREVLVKSGHGVETADSGREALQKIAAGEFDIVLMDVQMPGMNGLEAVQAIRAGEAGADKADVTVVAITAYALKGDKEKFLAAGMDGYLSKPLDIAELSELLGRFTRSGKTLRGTPGALRP